MASDFTPNIALMKALVPKADVNAVARYNRISIIVGKALLVFVGLWVAWTAAFCPCGVLYSCHLTELYAALFAGAVILFFFNGPRLLSYHSASPSI